jgi:hypothetical protein
MRAVLLPLMLAACAGGETATGPGSVGLCFDGPGVGMTEARGLWSVSGEVTSFNTVSDPEISGCTFVGDVQAWVSLVDDDGAAWAVGWSATAGSGVDEQELTPALDLAVGDRVDVQFSIWNDWATDAAVFLRDADSAVLAAATGYYSEVWPELTEGAGLTVTDAGATRSLGDEGCGKASTRALRFEADDRIDLDVWVEGTLTWDGTPLQARNVGAWAFDGEITCTDVWGPAPWIVYR